MCLYITSYVCLYIASCVCLCIASCVCLYIASCVCLYIASCVCLCIASCASVHCKVCVLSFGSGVCLSIAISCVPLHCKLRVALHSSVYSVVVCVGFGVTALIVIIYRSQVVRPMQRLRILHTGLNDPLMPHKQYWSDLQNDNATCTTCEAHISEYAKAHTTSEGEDTHLCNDKQ